MKAWLQRVTEASVSVDGEVVSKIGKGYLVLLGVAPDDDEAAADHAVLRECLPLRFHAPKALGGGDNKDIGGIVHKLQLPTIVHKSQIRLFPIGRLERHGFGGIGVVNQNGPAVHRHGRKAPRERIEGEREGSRADGRAARIASANAPCARHLDDGGGRKRGEKRESHGAGFHSICILAKAKRKRDRQTRKKYQISRKSFLS